MFSDKSHSGSKNVKTMTNKMIGWIYNGPYKIFELVFRPSTPSCQKDNVVF
jgi:hypothetical protein